MTKKLLKITVFFKENMQFKTNKAKQFKLFLQKHLL